MIGGDEKVYKKAFFTSLSEVKSVEHFVESIIPFIYDDTYDSFNYLTVISIANEEQKASLEKEIIDKNMKIRCKTV